MHVYHECQEGRLCGLHAINNLLQRPAFSQRDLNDIAKRLDKQERALIAGRRRNALLHAITGGRAGFVVDRKSNYSAEGDFSVQVIVVALQAHRLSVLSPREPGVSNAWGAIVSHRNHWAVFRKFSVDSGGGSEKKTVWVDLDSNISRPRMLSDDEVENLVSNAVAPRFGSRGLVFFVAGPLPQAARWATAGALIQRHMVAVVSPSKKVQKKTVPASVPAAASEASTSSTCSGLPCTSLSRAESTDTSEGCSSLGGSQASSACGPSCESLSPPRQDSVASTPASEPSPQRLQDGADCRGTIRAADSRSDAAPPSAPKRAGSKTLPATTAASPPTLAASDSFGVVMKSLRIFPFRPCGSEFAFTSPGHKPEGSMTISSI
eukprot:TRINITY_DN13391_c0_g1_i1.p1 TRINITY_DN13391_c0_g1~~TRINITY_DN13391_c0_g1_i1.p1  ORF type:complete len:378 (+),score=57.82 TRINITY_DN13391_c0_g1_i1:102-1235(+)